MNSKIDMAFCLDYTSSMASAFDQIKRIIFQVFDIALASGQNDPRTSLIKFRSHQDHPVTITYLFTGNRNVFKEWLYSDQPTGGSEDGYKAVGKKINF